MRCLWVEPDIRDNIISEVERMKSLTGLRQQKLVGYLGIGRSKFSSWKTRFGEENKHNSETPKHHQISPDEYQAVVRYAMKSESVSTLYAKNGYRRLTYMMIDKNIASISPSTTYRILKKENLLNRWNVKKSQKGDGYRQPAAPHKEWHVDIKYVNFRGAFLFFIGILDGFSRYIIHHELRVSMTELDVEITLQRALEKYPGKRPKVISDNGGQFISKEFGVFIREAVLKHVRTSVAYPQSNGKIERFHRSLGEECLKKESLLSLEDAQRVIAEYVNFYNEKRLHSSVCYLTPLDILEGRKKQRLNERKAKLEYARLRRLEYWKKHNKN